MRSGGRWDVGSGNHPTQTNLKKKNISVWSSFHMQTNPRKPSNCLAFEIQGKTSANIRNLGLLQNVCEWKTREKTKVPGDHRLDICAKKGLCNVHSSSWQKVQRVYCVHWAHLSIWFVSGWLSAAGYSSLSARKWGGWPFWPRLSWRQKNHDLPGGTGGGRGISHQREDKRLDDWTLSASCPTFWLEQTEWSILWWKLQKECRTACPVTCQLHW